MGRRQGRTLVSSRLPTPPLPRHRQSYGRPNETSADPLGASHATQPVAKSTYRFIPRIETRHTSRAKRFPCEGSAPHGRTCGRAPGRSGQADDRARSTRIAGSAQWPGACAPPHGRPGGEGEKNRSLFPEENRRWSSLRSPAHIFIWNSFFRGQLAWQHLGERRRQVEILS